MAAEAGSLILRALLALAFVLFATALPASEADDRLERITSFKSDITVGADGFIRVHETITVNAHGNEIRHGIFRDFPTLYPDGVRVRFDVGHVTRDGNDEPYLLESLENGTRVRIGSRDVTLDNGLHTYTIDYVTDRQIAYHANYDEFYWNVTGNAWQLRIDEVEATVHLPPGGRIIQNAFYTGAQGSKDTNAEAERIEDTTIRFRTTQILGTNEGLTIGVGFAKGAVAAPDLRDRFWYFVRDHSELAMFLIGLAVLLVYFGIAWLIGGRDPKGGTIIPLFEPPEDLSPASLRYIERMGYDGKMFSATLVSMAVKRFLTITQNENDTYTLKKPDLKATDAGLAPDEAEAARELFAHGSKAVVLVAANHTVVNKAIGALSRWLSLHFDHGYVLGNWRLFWPGLVIAFGVMIAIFASTASPLGAFLVTLWSSMSLIGALIFGLGAVAMWKDVFWLHDGKRGGSIFLALVFLIPTVAFAGMTYAALFFAWPGVPPYIPALIWALIPVLVIFRRLLRAPTAEGAKLRTAIKGFRLFLTTAEEDRLKALNPPEVTPKLFEKFLPYAIALDCETEWSRKFEAAAAHAGIDPATAAATTSAYQPRWYTGTSSNDFGDVGFAAAVGTALATATASAAVSPSSGSGFSSSSSSSSSFSSGSSGGGSSGGGGGGGGGGGW